MDRIPVDNLESVIFSFQKCHREKALLPGSFGEKQKQKTQAHRGGVNRI